jgi:hypothetical protein
MKKVAIFLALILLCLISLPGCSTTTERSSDALWENALTLFEPGKTTAKDVAHCFGSPQKEIMAGEKDRIWVYQGHNSLLALWFNKDGILTDLRYKKANDPDNMEKYAKLLLGYGRIRPEE